ncbi:putative aspartyl aminopeptidase [Tritrichomonas foetus]|uniref:aspartyl aminopeptidase n=1 Tax=Tritrichomonas foetus TaxID=1144522 RepID=A0A1J4JI00_9EUKA|nr:putative aspartyl aminopeptidase [Tritrichomonas foetus]|eukprot:OHS97879.1 putative aspartyl aminopeptidase [Tritrichomonas foetus]
MSSTKKELLQFLDQSPVPYFFNEGIRKQLLEAGYDELDEHGDWVLDDQSPAKAEALPKKGFLIRDNRALVAFNVGGYDSAIIVGTHSDSPCLKIRSKPDISSGDLKQVSVHTYGGGIWFTWLGRDLRLVGSATIRDENGKLVEKLIDSEDAIAFIPCSNFGNRPSPNTETQLRPIIGGKKSDNLLTYVANKLQVEPSEIVDWDLSFVDANPPAMCRNFVESMRLDNLGSTFSACKAFLNSEPKNTINILAVFDHEEVGSNSRFGAASDLLLFVLKRLVGGTNRLAPLIAKSLFVSSDNAHAVHPNFSTKHDKMHQPLLSKGVVLKSAPHGSYGTDMTSSYPLKHAAKACGVPLQMFMNRNDIPSGTTIGPIVSTRLGIPTVDIGQPQLSMHSIRETMAVKDADYLTKLLTELYNNYEEHRLKL